ncbi:hypothetical protein MNBD_CHLOROFLEXI01-554, partial [hydrothermal vent metagenome]
MVAYLGIVVKADANSYCSTRLGYNGHYLRARWRVRHMNEVGIVNNEVVIVNAVR